MDPAFNGPLDDIDVDSYSPEAELCLIRLYTEVCGRSVSRTLALLGSLLRKDREMHVLGVKCEELVAQVVFAAMLEGGEKRVRRVIDLMRSEN